MEQHIQAMKKLILVVLALGVVALSSCDNSAKSDLPQKQEFHDKGGSNAEYQILQELKAIRKELERLNSQRVHSDSL